MSGPVGWRRGFLRVLGSLRPYALWGAFGWLALIAPQAHAAEPLDVLGARVALPFEYRVLERAETRLGDPGITAMASVDIEVRSGPALGQRVRVSAYRHAPSALDQGTVQGLVRRHAEQLSGRIGTRSVRPLQIDGFGFYFIDARTGSGAYSDALQLYGTVNGAVHRVMLLVKDRSVLTPALIDGFVATRIDFEQGLRHGFAFRDEQTRAHRKGEIETPIGTIALPRGTEARMVMSSIVRDGEGHPMFRSRGFGLFKGGVLTQQSLYFWSGCGSEPTAASSTFIAMDNGDDASDGQKAADVEDSSYALQSGPVAASFAGVRGERSAGLWRPAGRLPRAYPVTRWAADAEAGALQAELRRYSGSEKMDEAFGRQLASLPPACRLDLTFGAQPAPKAVLDAAQAVPPVNTPAP